jgi:phage terminase small subunit
MSNNNKKPNAGTSKQSLEDRKTLFAYAYLANGHNGAQAVIAAGYSANGASTAAARLLKDVKVQAIIANRIKEDAEKYSVSADSVMRSIAAELFFDPAKLYNAAGELKNVTELDEDTRLAISSIDFVQIGDDAVRVSKYKWNSKSQAREQAMKYLGMFEKNNAQLSDPLVEFMKSCSGKSLPINGGKG